MEPLQSETAVFIEAANWVDVVVGALPASAWIGPGLGDWDMRALVGHTSRSLLTVEQYLGAPAGVEEVDSAEGYYERTGGMATADPAAVLRRGIDAGADLGDDPAAAFSTIVARVTALLSDEHDRLITTIAGGIRLSSYLPTRTFELVVHGLDIACAAGAAADPPEDALSRTLDLAVVLAARAGRGSEVLMALTGRRSLVTGFSVLR